MNTTEKKVRMPTSKYEWTPITERMPEPYALVLLALDSGRVVPGWWSGTGWDGRRLKHDAVVKAFKPVDFQINNSQYSLDHRNAKKRK